MLPEDDTVLHGVKDLRCRDRNDILDIRVIPEDLVDMVGEGFLLGVENGVDDGLCLFIHGLASTQKISNLYPMGIIFLGLAKR